MGELRGWGAQAQLAGPHRIDGLGHRLTKAIAHGIELGFCTGVIRQLSEIPDTIEPLKASFYAGSTEELDGKWNSWLQRWRELLESQGNLDGASAAMKRANPAITWREWLVAPAYEQAREGDTTLIKELQQVFSTPYEAPPAELARYDQLKPREFFNAGGVSHYSCSS